MSNKEAINLFKQEVLPEVIKKYGKNDRPAINQAFNDFTDNLCKDGLISSKQYNNIILFG